MTKSVGKVLNPVMQSADFPLRISTKDITIDGQNSPDGKSQAPTTARGAKKPNGLQISVDDVDDITAI